MLKSSFQNHFFYPVQSGAFCLVLYRLQYQKDGILSMKKAPCFKRLAPYRDSFLQHVPV
jgi:hypothetical protein